MPSRPLVWLTVFFMLGISADQLAGGALRLPPVCLPLSATALIACMAVLLARAGAKSKESKTGSGEHRLGHLSAFVASAMLFFLFGVWAFKAAAPRFPQALQPYLDGRPGCFLAEVSGAPDYYPDRIRVELHLLCAMTRDGQTPLDGGILLSMPANEAEASGDFLLPGDRVLFRAVLKKFHNFNNPGGFDYTRYRAEEGLYGHCFLKNQRLLIKIAPSATLSPGAIFNAIRGRIEL
ncbi:MAG: ComEC/Rec2 family competence protein, partial [Syntrophobacteraceae bacterium]